jgi:hypothetical protein
MVLIMNGSLLSTIGQNPIMNKDVHVAAGAKYLLPTAWLLNFQNLLKNGIQGRMVILLQLKLLLGSRINVWWKCPNGSDHEWQTRVGHRTNRHFKSGCPFCRGLQVSITNSLSTLFPEIAKQWHPTKNGQITPEQVVAGSNKQYWWKCPNGSDHEWRVKVNSRTSFQTGCPFCVGKQVSVTNSLATRFPEIAKQWHHTKNGSLTPEQIVSGSNTKYWWKCPNGLDHEWFTSANKRVSAGHNCPFCGNQKVSVTNSLATCFPDIAKQWHPTKNGNLNPDQVIAGSEKKVWWRCEIDPSHSWEAMVYRTKLGFGCPTCNRRWTLQAIRGFVSSLINHLETFTSAELYLLLQQSGLILSKGKGKGFVKALATGRFPKEEVEKFVNGKPSTVDKFLQDKQLTLEALETSDNDNIPDKGDVTSEDNLDDQIDETVEPSEEDDDLDLPVVQTREVLASLDHSVVSSADEEAVEFLIASAKAKIWKHVFRDEAAAVAQAQSYTGDSYAQKVNPNS